MSENPRSPEETVAWLNETRGGWNEHLGLVFVRASPEEVVARVDVQPAHYQPYGIVHGGVYASIAETIASVGAALHAMREGRHAVGLDNTTSFLRATRGGRLEGTATPLAAGRRTQLWQVEIRDDDERLVATSRVRLLTLEGDAVLAGEKVTT